MNRIKIKCPNKDCNSEIDFTFESPEECPECGRVLFPAIDQLAKEVSKKLENRKREVQEIFNENNIKSKFFTNLEGFPGCFIIIKKEEGIEKVKKLVERYNQKHEKRKRIIFKRDLLCRDNLVVYPKIAIQDARIDIRRLEMYRFLKFIINKKHTI